ncbi:enoyl-[acyl-carrier-protein] reductase FabL [Limnochorda pilosa]|uniref:Enoyl-ACP reductase n=1 Tax=Limnochorda pilosa TaxID=1555112 RepID=A0A0K2SIL8_LIMPI|nr:enoyl-ACP reductase [Limnochorda pilosa]
MEGKVALITGGSRGIGRAIALELARRGARVAVNYVRNRQAAEETVAAIEERGGEAAAFKANVAEPEKVDALFDQLDRWAGGLDILVNNAASGVLRPLEELEPKHWDWAMNINARGAFLCARRAVPRMKARGGGAIVNLTSLGSQRVLPSYVGVGVSKAALEALTRYLAVDLAPFGITVNALSGGAVETDALRHFPDYREIVEETRRRVPAGRMVEPEDLARVAAFLCSPEAAMIQGQVIVVDGGLSLVG